MVKKSYKMKNYLLLFLAFTFFVTTNAQEITTSKPIKTFYKSGDQIIQTLPNGDGVVFMFQDERYDHIDATESVIFKDKEAMLYFFDKVNEVQQSPKTDKTVDLTVSMNDYVLNDEDVTIIRRGSKQFVTYIYVDKAYSIIPKTYLKKLLKKIKE
jgi:hypothetical protein